ncbi:MAG: ABC transporter substrate-binding protein [Pseudomonadota bacterium]
MEVRVTNTAPAPRRARARRRFLARVAGLAGAACLAGAASVAGAAGAAPELRIASLFTRSANGRDAGMLEAALALENPALAARIRVDAVYADFDPARLATLARQVVLARPALIVCHDQTALTAMLAARAQAPIPIVFRAHDDPLAHGLIGSYARPGRNLTGITTYRCADDKMLEILHDALPGVRRVGFLFNASVPDGGCHARARQYAAELGMTLQEFDVASVEQVGGALAKIGGARVEAMIVPASAAVWKTRKQVVAHLNAHAIPAIYEGQAFLDVGGLMHFGAIQDDALARMARDVVKILQGESAGDIPVSQPTRFELVINMKAERARDYRLSARVLRRADRILE